MVDHAVGAGHHKHALIAQLLQRHMQGANRHGGGDSHLLRRHAGGYLVHLLLVERGQRKGVADGQFALQLRGFLHGFDHVVHRRHARRAGFVQVNIHPFVVIQRNLEHGVERFLHRPVNVGWVQPAHVVRPGLHRLAHQLFGIRQQQAVLWKRHDLALKSGLATRQHRLQVLEILQARDRLNIAVAAGEGGAFRLDQIDQLFGALLGIRLEFGEQLLLKADHILNGGTRRAVERTPRAAVEGFIQVNVHIAHRREHQLAACVIVRQGGVRVTFVIPQGDNFPVFDLQRFQLGASARRNAAVDVKSGLQQHVVQVVVFSGDVHRFARLAGWFCGIGSIRDGAGRAKQRAGGDHFAALADEFTAAFIFTHLIFLH
ncbi:Uncharacterised protein [Enterobacter cloacae]|nr:Uncharacterised protein [Enterobacter cloacae]